jgi:hypothetical protein
MMRTWLVLATMVLAALLAMRIGMPATRWSRGRAARTVAMGLVLGLLVTVLAISVESSVMTLVG